MKTNETGNFTLKVAKENGVLEISKTDFKVFSRFLDLENETDSINLGQIRLVKELDIETVDLFELQQSDDNEDIANGNLFAYYDVFSRVAAFDFRQVNFQRRGIGQDYGSVSINGLKINDLELNRPVWSWWGGLNDAFKDQNHALGNNYFELYEPNVGGVINFNILPSSKPKKLKTSVSGTNFSYMGRAMASYSSGTSPKGWSILANGSVRWGNNHFFPGVFYNSASLLLGVEKEVSLKYSFSLIGFFAPLNRSGRTVISEEEAVLSKDKEDYNPYWGFQNGKERYSRIQKSRQPFFLLNQKYNFDDKTSLQSNISYRFGTYSRSRLEFYNEADPEPNNPRYLPSNFDFGTEAFNLALNAFQNDVNYYQINWNRIYDINRTSPTATIPNANGSEIAVTGKRATFIIENNISDDSQFLGNLTFNKQVKENVSITFGTYFSSLNRNYYKEIEDLLGADFWIDIDRFLEFDYPSFSNETQNDLQNPNRIVKKGDRFGFDYAINSTKWNSFLQLKSTTYPLEYNIGAYAGLSSFFRKGFYQKGIFPNNSLGKSKTNTFLELQGNIGLTYYLNGKSSFSFSSIFRQNAPRGEFIFPQARNNNITVPNLKTEKIASSTVSFSHKSSNWNLITSIYLINIANKTDRSLVLLDLDDGGDIESDFLSVTIQDIKQQFIGLEIGVNYQLNSTINLVSGMVISEHEYKNNPTLSVSNDDVEDTNGTKEKFDGKTAFFRGLDVDASPQYAFSSGLEYRNPKFWFAKFSVNFFERSFVKPNPLNRTKEVIESRIQNNPTLTAKELIRQDEFDQGFSFNLSFGKSWRLKKSWYLSSNIFINNLLNNRMQTWGLWGI